MYNINIFILNNHINYIYMYVYIYNIILDVFYDYVVANAIVTLCNYWFNYHVTWCLLWLVVLSFVQNDYKDFQSHVSIITKM